MTLIFSKNSWHFRLASEYSTLSRRHPEYDASNSCSYIYHVLRGLAAVFGVIFVSSLVGSLLIGPALVWWAFMVLNWVYVIPSDLAIVSSTAWFVGLGALAINYCMSKVSRWVQIRRYERWEKSRKEQADREAHPELYQPKPPTAFSSFILSAYSKFKDKVCMKVEFKEE